MKKVALLYNPLAGGRLKRRLADVKAVVAVLREAGVEVIASPTRVASDATPQVRQAIAEGCDTVFACGGAVSYTHLDVYKRQTLRSGS